MNRDAHAQRLGCQRGAGAIAGDALVIELSRRLGSSNHRRSRQRNKGKGNFSHVYECDYGMKGFLKQL